MTFAKVGLVLASLTLAACGSGDSGSTDTSPEPPDTASSAADATVESSQPPMAIEPSTVPPPTTQRTTAPATSESPVITVAPATTSAAVADCHRFDDFDDPGGWFIINDGVMGGRSDGRASIGDSTLRFFGSVVTDGGGFTSIRLGLAGDELVGTERILVRMRPDDRTYGVRFEDDQRFDGRRISHGADLEIPESVDAEGYVVVEVAYDELEPTVFGFDVEAEPFRPDAATEIGIIIADGIDGEFAIDVDWIDTCS